MGESGMDDPFLWEVDRVVQELCTTNRSWPAPTARKLPDPTALEAVIREQDLDGESLLTYGDVFGIEPLWNVLGIRKAPHQLSINAAIRHFKKRSCKYREWKRSLSAASGSDDEASEPAQGIKHPSGTSSDDQPPRLTAGGSQAITPSADSNSAPGIISGKHTESAGPLASAHTELPVETSFPANLSSLKRAFDDTATSNPAAVNQQVGEARPAKRRAALTTLSVKPVYATGFDVPTEADAISTAIADRHSAGKTIQSSQFAFLGTTTIVTSDILKPLATVSDEREFCWTRAQKSPPGRQIQIASAMKRLLQRDPLIVEIVDPTEPEDEVLPLYGESDDEGSIDSETWEEYQKEQKKLSKPKPEPKPLNVEEVVDSAIEHLKNRWISKKKSSNDRKARQLWDNARRSPYRLELIRKMKTRQAELEQVISDKKKWVLSTVWESKEELESRCPDFFELSVGDLQYAKWYIALLENPHPPPKLEPLPRAPRRQDPASDSSDEGDDVTIQSDSDESDGDIQGWIEHDDPMDSDSHLSLRSQSRSRSLIPDLPAISDAETESSLPQSATPVRKLKSELVTVPATLKKDRNLAREDIIEILSSPTTDSRFTELPGFNEPEKIEQMGVAHWARMKDAERLVIAVLSSWSWNRKALAFNAIKHNTPSEVWEVHVQQWVEGTLKKHLEMDIDTASFALMRLFDCYISCTADRQGNRFFNRVTLQRIYREEARFEAFCDLLLGVMPHFEAPTPQTPTRIKLINRPENPQLENSSASQASDDDASELSEETSGENQPLSSTKKRRRRRRRDQNAQKLRVTNLEQLEEFDKRRALLRQQLAESGQISSDKTRLIVNETKEAHQSLIYINDHIGSKIKDHQIDGIRFMWNHVVAKSKFRQGCLLAHEMGLGKTMQAITLLVVIAEASLSNDPSIYSQIPRDLRESKTLILCPAGLVDNWIDELLLWAPKQLLGPLLKFDSSLSERDRVWAIEDWASKGGVLVSGYSLFTQLVNKGGPIADLLQKAPNIVIADEAHQLKNPTSQRTQAASNFRTMSRIALTGSPLTKHVMDYYAMINWVAPGFLADIAEFRQRFETPITQGLYADSEPFMKRKARKMLHILKETVGPLVNRKDVQVLRETLPGKKEFILTLPLTKVQMKAYAAYLEAIQNPAVDLSGQSKVWSLVSVLARLLAHPQIFKKTLEDRKKGNRKGDSEEDEALESIPPDLLSETLATMSTLKTIGDVVHSNKVRILFAILEQCRQIGDKVLVFSQSLEILNYLENALKQQKRNFQRLDGRTPVGERQASVKQFNTDKDAEIYLISTKAGGVGLNINGANRVVIFDFKYTPAEEQQAIGRAYRIGQEKPVCVYWLTVGGTFEAAILNNAVFKTQLASRVVDKKNPNPKSNKHGEYFIQPTLPEQEDLSEVKGKDPVLDFLLTDSELKGIVRKVITTETFVEEEVYELPPEDKREAEEDIEIERLRIQNPEEYRRRDQERNMRGRVEIAVPAPPPVPPLPLLNPMHMQSRHPCMTQPIPPYAVSGPGPSTTTGPPAVIGPAITTDGPSAATHNAVPSNRNDFRADLSPHPRTPTDSRSPSPGQGIVKPVSDTPSTPAFTSFLGKPKAHSMSQAGNQSSSEPVLAPGTHYKDEGVELFGAFFKELEKPVKEAYDRLHASGYRQEGGLVTAKEAATNIIEGISDKLDEVGCLGLQRMDRTQNISSMLGSNPRLLEALVTGYWKPGEVASFERHKLRERVDWLNGLDEAQYKSAVWRIPRAPEKLPATRERRSNNTTVDKTKLRTAGDADLEALMQELEERSSKVPNKTKRHDRRPSAAKPLTPRNQPRVKQPGRPGDSAESPHIIDD